MSTTNNDSISLRHAIHLLPEEKTLWPAHMADLIVRLNLYNTGMKRTREARPERLAMPAVQPRAARPAIVADVANGINQSKDD